MFTCSPGGRLGKYRGAIIHFGGRYKSIEQDWEEWLAKYENLLRHLYWQSAVVYLETEVAGHYRFQWWLSSAEFKGFLERPPRLPRTWEFEGPFRRWWDA